MGGLGVAGSRGYIFWGKHVVIYAGKGMIHTISDTYIDFRLCKLDMRWRLVAGLKGAYAYVCN